jgi:hypothetical protein
MTGQELAQRFIDYSNTSGHPRAEPNEPMATLYGLDEVVVDHQARTVLLPDFGLVQCPTLRPTTNVDWYATTPIPNVGLQFVMGAGDPFTPAPANPLPTKGMFVMALPYAILAAASKQTNRAQRRSMRRS